MLAQDKRSVVLGERHSTSHSPVGAVRNHHPSTFQHNQQLATHTEKQFLLDSNQSPNVFDFQNPLVAPAARYGQHGLADLACG